MNPRLEQVRVAGDRVERRAQLVTHRSQEETLRAIGIVRLREQARLFGGACSELVIAPFPRNRDRHVAGDHAGELQLGHGPAVRRIAVQHELAEENSVVDERHERKRPYAFTREHRLQRGQ